MYVNGRRSAQASRSHHGPSPFRCTALHGPTLFASRARKRSSDSGVLATCLVSSMRSRRRHAWQPGLAHPRVWVECLPRVAAGCCGCWSSTDVASLMDGCMDPMNARSLALSHDSLELLRLRFRRSGASAMGLGGLVTEHTSNGTTGIDGAQHTLLGRRPQQHSATGIPHGNPHSGAIRLSAIHSRGEVLSIAGRIVESPCMRVAALRTSMVCIGCIEILLCKVRLWSRQGSNCTRYMRESGVAHILWKPLGEILF